MDNFIGKTFYRKKEFALHPYYPIKILGKAEEGKYWYSMPLTIDDRMHSPISENYIQDKFIEGPDWDGREIIGQCLLCDRAITEFTICYNCIKDMYEA